MFGGVCNKKGVREGNLRKQQVLCLYFLHQHAKFSPLIKYQYLDPKMQSCHLTYKIFENSIM
jgi:hypothetical protein